jgi:hypothetical protein
LRPWAAPDPRCDADDGNSGKYRRQQNKNHPAALARTACVETQPGVGRHHVVLGERHKSSIRIGINSPGRMAIAAVVAMK